MRETLLALWGIASVVAVWAGTYYYTAWWAGLLALAGFMGLILLIRAAGRIGLGMNGPRPR